MTCEMCGATVSCFDVHCRACGARREAPPPEHQFAALGIDLDTVNREQSEQDLSIAREAHQARLRAHRRDVTRTVLEGMAETVSAFFREVFRP